MLVGAGALDSPLEVTRFEFTIKSCRCTKTCEGVGTSDFCKAEIAPLPYNAEFTTNSEHGRTLFAPTYIRDSLSCRKFAPLFAYLRFAMGKYSGADLILRYHFHLISDFYMLFFIKSAPCRLAPNEALPHTPLGALPLDPTSPLAPGLSVRFISRFARCFILLYACNLLWSAMLIPHSSLLTPHFSFLPSSLKIRPHILQFTSKCAIIISIGGLIHEKTLFRNFYELFRLRHDNFLGCSRDRPRLLFH